MTTTGTTTTESPRRRDRIGFSVRTRITVVATLLTALALAGAGLLVHLLESARVERQTNEQIDQEIDEFAQFQRGEGSGSAEEVLTAFLGSNVPDDDEMIVVYPPNGEAAYSSPNDYGEPLLVDPVYLDALDQLRETGGTLQFEDVDPYGEVWVTVVPVQQAGAARTGSLVVVNFLDDERSEIGDTIRTYTIVSLLSLGLILLLASSQSGRLLAPLRTLRDTADEISDTDLSRRIPERGNDDITALTRTLNRMLDRVETGVTAQRRFLDDAGHELKTPLTVLRGHLELLDPDDPDDVGQTRDLLLEETDRMSRLVGDLILLAKADRPDFVTLRSVPVATVTAGVLAKARALGERDWQDDGAAAATVLADDQRLTQALLQLADNAVKHTGPGDVVAVGSSADSHGVRLWVRDTGDGVPEADRERIFQRFGRSTVREDDEGFGLGLSIVGAIVAAHDGTVLVEDAAPHGSRFVITLPRPPYVAPAPAPYRPPSGTSDTITDDTPTAELPRIPGARDPRKEPSWPAS